MKKTTTKAIVGEVLPAEVPPDLALVETDGTAVSAFLSGLVPFFRGALVLEREAVSLLAEAKRTKEPTSGAQDAVIQTNIKRASLLTKRAEGYWTIAGVLHGLHRKVTAGRARATGPAAEAAAYWQAQHNGWADSERRRVAREQEVLRLAAEAEAQAERDRELAELERLAVEAEQDSPTLSERERAFVVAHLNGRSPEQAAQAAGFKDAFKSATRLLATEKIQVAMKAARDAAVLRQQATARAEAPLPVNVREVRPDIKKVGSDRDYWSAEVTDEDAFIAAFVAGKHGIPRRVITVLASALNEEARAFHYELERWPGIKVTKKTTTV